MTHWAQGAKARRSWLARGIGIHTLALLGAVFVLLTAPSANAQQEARSDLLRDTLRLSEVDTSAPAVLEANEISVDQASQTVSASGDVRVYFADRVLVTDMLSYNQQTDIVIAQGNVRLVNPDGTVIEADRVEIDSQLRDGLIEGARAVLGDGNARIAAVEARRIDGAYTAFSKTVFSPCDVCEDEPVPLWRIRARRVIQDEQAKDIIYEDATLDVYGVPVVWLPYFRHADPTVERRTGFLAPEIFGTESLGYAIKIPYYVELSPHRDMTVTGFLATDDNPVLEGQYREKFVDGDLDISASITHSDDALQTGTRGHFEGHGETGIRSLDNRLRWSQLPGIAEGRFDTGWRLGFDSVIASDDAYLRRYRYSDEDRVQSRAYFERFSLSGFTSLEAVRYQSFRDDEYSGDIPFVLPHLSYQQDLEPTIFGGILDISGDFLFLSRTGQQDDDLNALTQDQTNGRDVLRFSGGVGWRRNHVTVSGIELEGYARMRADLYRTLDDSRLGNGVQTRVLPAAGVTARYPLGKRTDGATHMLEPFSSLIIAPYGGNPNTIANEDSQDAELDELSIASFSRFPGIDRWEDGPRATLGVHYSRVPDAGPEIDVMLGQSFRLRESSAFSEASGLRNAESDLVGAWRVSTAPHLTFGHRFRVSYEGIMRRNEVYASAEYQRLQVQGSYIYLRRDPEAGTDADREEGLIRAMFGLDEEWTLVGDVRRDFENSRFVNASGGLRFANECCEIDFKVKRRFNDVDDVPSSTDFGLVLRLKSLGTE
ncbi:MAG: LPS assembly protein LptD [Neomegalonema sp.]|nr:LPS assembly protein LptD [Neomegalonema sp.]